MINDIKLDKLALPESPKVRHEAQKSVTVEKTEGIVIGKSLDKMVSFLQTTEEMPGEAERVKAMKNRIENHDYRVDTDALSEKLVHHLINGI